MIVHTLQEVRVVKVTIKIPIPGGEPMEIVADGTPKEAADFIRLWLASMSSFQANVSDGQCEG